MNSVLNCMGHKLLFDDIVSAKNCTLVDSRGNEYLDLESGIWCTSIGHSNENVTKTINSNANRMIHSGYCYSTNQVEATASKILRIANHNDGKSMFLCSGSETVDLAISIANHLTKKPTLLTMSDSYLSAFGNFTIDDPQKWYKHNWLDEESIENIPFEKISAFIFEPGSSSGLVRFPPVEVVKTIIERVEDNGGIVIANEVTTGIGRTGKWFGYNHYEIEPDIVAMGKGLGNGYPVSCVSMSSKVVNGIDFRSFHYGQSHQNDPLGAAIAQAVLTEIEKDKLLEMAIEKGRYFKKRINDFKNKYGIIKEIRGRGLMLAIEFEKNDSASIAERINEKLLEKLIILAKRPNHEVFRIDPSLTITREDIDYFLTNLEGILIELEACS